MVLGITLTAATLVVAGLYIMGAALVVEKYEAIVVKSRR